MGNTKLELKTKTKNKKEIREFSRFWKDFRDPGRIFKILEGFSRKIKIKKFFFGDFGKDFHHFGRFWKILLAKSPARASQPSKTYWDLLDPIEFS